MSNKSVAKRTRSSALEYRNKRIKRTRELYQKTKVLYDCMPSQSTFKEVILLMEQLHEKIQQCNEVTPTQKSKDHFFQLEHRLKAFLHKLKRLQGQIFDAQHIMDNIFVGKLHPHDCMESAECILKMQRKLKEDPLSLERYQAMYHDLRFTKKSVTETCPPLHSAAMRAHVKCVKFLLERGADVTSMTSQSETILDSLYDSNQNALYYHDERLAILELLLQYGVSNMIQENPYAGELPLLQACGNSTQEVSLLLRHGAAMHLGATQSTILEEWETFNLPTIKLLFLYHRIRLNFGPGFHVNLEKIIQSCYYKMVLAGVPSNECHEKVLEALHFYKIFGGKFPVSATKESYRDLMQFLKNYKHRRHFNDIKSEIKALVSNPLSLQEISRLAVRKCIHRNYDESVKELPLPQELQSFLRFDDVTITELPEDFYKYGEDEYDSSDGEVGSDIE